MRLGRPIGHHLRSTLRKDAARTPGLVLHSPSEERMRKAFDVYAGMLRDAASQMSATALTKNIDKLPWKNAGAVFKDAWLGAVSPAMEKGYDKAAAKFPEGEQKELVFTLENPYATKWTETNGAELVTNVENSTKEALRQEVNRGFVDKIPVAQIARTIRGYKSSKTGKVYGGIVGLLPRDSGAVSKYHARLVSGGMTEERVSELANRYANRLLNRRGENIARTEVAQAQNAGTLNAWSEATSKGFVSKRARKVWITAWDERTCPACAPMHNVKVKPDEKFDTPLGEVDAPPIHPNCRCDIALVTPSAGREPKQKPDHDAQKKLAERRAKHARAQAKLNRKRLARGTKQKRSKK